MTVGELRMLLENIPDDYEVMISRYEPDEEVENVMDFGNYEIADVKCYEGVVELISMEGLR